MDKIQVEESHRTWQTLLSDWDSLDKRLFDHPTEWECINLRFYLEALNESIEHHFDVIEFVLQFYGSAERYMRMKKGDLDKRNKMDYFCSENNLLTFRRAYSNHLKPQEVEDMERLLMFYLIDSNPPPIEAKSLRTT